MTMPVLSPDQIRDTLNSRSRNSTRGCKGFYFIEFDWIYEKCTSLISLSNVTFIAFAKILLSCCKIIIFPNTRPSVNNIAVANNFVRSTFYSPSLNKILLHSSILFVFVSSIDDPQRVEYFFEHVRMRNSCFSDLLICNQTDRLVTKAVTSYHLTS